ncbi:hypothetical protein UM181_01085 [Alphaproteobacteria bacterium US3C007]|nr:hypothetical protein UM181_01085 [Alphaproteobacteria bacterium US3C007]
MRRAIASQINQCGFFQKGATYPEQNSIPNGVITPWQEEMARAQRMH